MQDEKISHEVVRARLVKALPRVWRFALSLTGTRDRAEDLVQATSVRVLERVHLVTSLERIDSWFLTICRSIWLNELRAQTLRRAQSLQDVPEAELAADGRSGLPTGEANIFLSEVFGKVMALPEAQRSVAVLVFVEGHAYREVAEILDIPVGTVMSRLHAARKTLRDGLGREAERDEAK